MRIDKTSRKFLLGLAIAVAAAGVSTEAIGQDHFRGPRVVLDARYHHDRYYPARGFMVDSLPAGAMGIVFGSGRYFFHAGVWFRPMGARFEVVTPPVGIVIPTLPPGYMSLTIGGAPFFYANGVYYAPTPGAGFTVVEPPSGADAVQVSPPAALPTPAASDAQPNSSAPREPVVYPRNGQSAAQADADRGQCQQWAATQAAGRASDPTTFDRAFVACLDGRGYTVR